MNAHLVDILFSQNFYFSNNFSKFIHIVYTSLKSTLSFKILLLFHFGLSNDSLQSITKELPFPLLYTLETHDWKRITRKV